MINVDIHLANSVTDDIWNDIFEYLNDFYDYNYFFCQEEQQYLYMRITLDCSCIDILTNLNVFESRINHLIVNYPIHKVNVNIQEHTIENEFENIVNNKFIKKFTNSLNGYFINNYSEMLMKVFGFEYEIIDSYNSNSIRHRYVYDECYVKTFY